MKIEKGYTREQFIDKIQKRQYQKYLKFYSDFNDFAISNLGLIYRFNKLLKQPLTKDMFVNPFKKPESKAYYGYESDLKQWEAAENKVIFKGKKIVHNIDCIEYEHNKEVSVFYYPNDNNIMIYANNIGTWLDDLKTISDIFQATNGALITKNINI